MHKMKKVKYFTYLKQEYFEIYTCIRLQGCLYKNVYNLYKRLLSYKLELNFGTLPVYSLLWYDNKIPVKRC